MTETVALYRARKGIEKLFQNYIMYKKIGTILTLLHPERPKLYAILAFLSVIGLKQS